MENAKKVLDKTIAYTKTKQGKTVVGGAIVVAVIATIAARTLKTEGKRKR